MTTFRRVETKDDIARVAALARETWRQHYVPIIGQAQVDYMLELFQSEKAIADQIAGSTEYNLVLDDECPVGYLATVADVPSRRMMLSKIYVRKADRGRGHGKAALRRAEDLCRERGMRTLWLTVNRHNTQSIQWYTHMGFENAGPVMTEIGQGFIMDDFMMEKSIPDSNEQP